MSHSLSPDGDGRPATHTPVALIVLAWALVGIPLVYGLIRTMLTAANLFG